MHAELIFFLVVHKVCSYNLHGISRDRCLSKPISFFVEGLSAHALGSFGIINPWEQLGQAKQMLGVVDFKFFSIHTVSLNESMRRNDMIVFDFQFQSSLVAKAIN